jgi:hypothetical protein
MTKPVNRTRPAEKGKGKVDGNLLRKDATTAPPYSSKIIKAGALIPDTKALLSSWDSGLSVSENLQRMRHQNLLGKTSRSRAEDILAIFRQRYLVEEPVARALATIVSRQSNGNTLDRILYFHAVRADSLLHDVVIELLVPHWSRGIMEIDSLEIESALRKWVEEGKTSGPWGDSTVRRVTQGVLSTLRDFGVLQGAVKKRIAPAYLSVQAFAYIAFYLKQHQPSGTNARFILGVLQGAISLKGLTYPHDLKSFNIEQSDSLTNAPKNFPKDGEGLYNWAMQLEKNVCDALDSFERVLPAGVLNLTRACGLYYGHPLISRRMADETHPSRHRKRQAGVRAVARQPR